jgi:hypothetical protein
MNIPLNFNTNNTEIKGRTHFGGDIYVSLSDKQIDRPAEFYGAGALAMAYRNFNALGLDL